MEIRYGLKYFFMNKIVNKIPFWFIRKQLYRVAGLKIGKSHILMNVTTDGWSNIVIGDGVCINQNCHIDGRGGLTIEDNASISLGTVILTASHNSNSNNFECYRKNVMICERVWTGANSIVLPGTILGKGSILAAGSVAIGKKYDDFSIYSGVPAVKIGERNENLDYDLSGWSPTFR